MKESMCIGIDKANENDRIEKFDKTVDALTELAKSMSEFEGTSKSIKETIGDLVVAKNIYKNR